MRRPRLKAPDDFPAAIYHCVSRVVNREMVLGEVEKEEFVRLMRVYERLFGLRVVTFCVMSNHFHILVEVPRRPEVMPTDAELVALVRECKGALEAGNLAFWLDHWRNHSNEVAAEQERERYFNQMWDVSQFMKVLKQRFSQWFNGRCAIRRKGTLWEERFRSVLVEDGEALHAISAYIDLNPVRAGIVGDPKDYRWSGYGEACAGQMEAVAGLMHAARTANVIVTQPGINVQTQNTKQEISNVLAWYRAQLFGNARETTNEDGTVKRRGLKNEKIEEVLDAKGRLPRHVYLHMRVRYFTDGAVIGTKAFVEMVFQASRSHFSSKRKSGPRRMKGLDFNDSLRTARALVKNSTG